MAFRRRSSNGDVQDVFTETLDEETLDYFATSFHATFQASFQTPCLFPLFRYGHDYFLLSRRNVRFDKIMHNALIDVHAL